ncbi:hypothetical protein ACF1BE_19615 [Streptomyces sp. NPDC014991]|uniref:hypothetical protein n=1 Tax=Streptomyces sp. NPDC014991 TaxID=3364935 RepID=UPI0037017EA9
MLALHGIIADRAATFRVGTLALISSAALHLHMTSRLNTHAVMAHQATLARMSMRERQQYAEMGYKARCFEALTEDAPETTGAADIVRLPVARHAPQMRRNGSA